MALSDDSARHDPPWSVFFPRDDGNATAILSPLKGAVSSGALVLSLLLEALGSADGPDRHDLLGRWLEGAESGTEDPGAWFLCQEVDVPGRQPGPTSRKPPTAAVLARKLAHATREAAVHGGFGVYLASWNAGAAPPRGGTRPPCPRVLYCLGPWPAAGRWLAVFNSRKPRHVPAGAPWLRALRTYLPALAHGGMGLVSSSGALTYDLTSWFARSMGTPLILVSPHGLLTPGDETGGAVAHGGGRVQHAPTFRVSCSLHRPPCDGTRRRLCRDRLIAHLADHHLVLQIRRNGNLRRILSAQQRERPRRQWVLVTPPTTQGDGTKAAPIGTFPGWAFPLLLPTPRPAFAHDCQPARRHAGGTPVAPAHVIDWRRYLCHYVRSHPGPWPGQSEDDYLAELFAQAPGCSREAGDTLVRILREMLVRASSAMTRGELPVVSWSARGPLEFAALRRWNRALTRWTLEPFGIAVNRRELHALGARPAIYGPEVLHAQLRHEHRFRFQLHAPPHCNWKHEREWRLPADLALHAVADGVVFVKDIAAAQRLFREVVPVFPVVSLASEAPTGFPGDGR